MEAKVAPPELPPTMKPLLRLALPEVKVEMFDAIYDALRKHELLGGSSG